LAFGAKNPADQAVDRNRIGVFAQVETDHPAAILK
jgi:hypothetical protein